VNFFKFQRLAEQVARVKECQQHTYSLQPVATIQDYLLRELRPVNADLMYQMSCAIEPREQQQQPTPPPQQPQPQPTPPPPQQQPSPSPSPPP
jgi:hypothetical protein